MRSKVNPFDLATTIETHISRRLSRFSTFALLLLGLAVIALPSSGQNRNTGEIRGTVVDTAGAVIAGATVDAMNVETGIRIHAVTGGAGEYDLPLLEAGLYDVTISKPNFKTSLQTGITLHIETITVNATLEVGALSTQVSVSSRPSLLQTETSEISTVLPTEEVAELPNVSRSWESYIALIPGAYPAIWGQGSMAVLGQANTGYGQNVGIGGAQGSETSWLIDGGVATLPVSYNIDELTAPLAAIEEINIVTNTPGSEMGNGLSSANIITKSGTNRFHGELSEFVQNSVFNAQQRNWSSTPVPKPHTIWNEYSIAVGGPIIRNRLFFFFDFQSNPQTSYTTYLTTFPTDDMRAGDFSGLLANGMNQSPAVNFSIFDPKSTKTVNGITTRTPFSGNKITSGFDSSALLIQKYLPEPNAINPSNPYYNNYYFSAANPQTQKWYDFKVDGNLSARNHIYVSGLTTTVSQQGPAPACNIQCDSDNITEFSNQLSDTFTFSPTKLNEFRASIAREAGYWVPQSIGKGFPALIGLPNLAADNFPQINISQGLGASLGAGLDAKIVETSIAISDTFNWIIGKHTIKFGGEYDNWTDIQGYAVNTAGTFNFNGIDTRDPSGVAGASNGVGYADFLLGGVQTWSNTLQLEYGGRDHNLQLYAQDSHKVRPNLTLNYGLRFLYQSGWTEEHNRWDTYVPTLMNPATNTLGAVGYAGVQIPAALENSKVFFAPRGGFAYTPKPLWVVHGGFGIYAEPWSGNAYFSQAGIGSGFEPSGNLAANPNNLTPVFQLQDGNPPLITPTAANRTPSLYNGQSIGEVDRDTPIAFAEEWNFGVQHQMGNYLVAATYVGNKGVNLPFSSDVNQIPESQLGSGVRPQPTFQSIGETRYIGRSNYNSLQMTGKRQFAAGASFTVNYTWSKTLDTGTGFGGGGNGIDVWQNAYDLDSNYGRSANDIRQTVNVHGLYQLPFGRGRKYANSSELSDLFIGGWEVSAMYQFHTGVPFNLSMSGNNNDGALSGTWYPNVVPGKNGRLSHPSTKEWFDTSAFVSPDINTFGDAQRNMLSGPRFWDTDLSVAKTWAIPALGEKTSFQFKADSYDVFNHPNYGQPNASVGSGSGYGTISSSLINRVLQFGGIVRF